MLRGLSLVVVSGGYFLVAPRELLVVVVSVVEHRLCVRGLSRDLSEGKGTSRKVS